MIENLELDSGPGSSWLPQTFVEYEDRATQIGRPLGYKTSPMYLRAGKRTQRNIERAFRKRCPEYVECRAFKGRGSLVHCSRWCWEEEECIFVRHFLDYIDHLIIFGVGQPYSVPLVRSPFVSAAGIRLLGWANQLLRHVRGWDLGRLKEPLKNRKKESMCPDARYCGQFKQLREFQSPPGACARWDEGECKFTRAFINIFNGITVFGSTPNPSGRGRKGESLPLIKNSFFDWYRVYNLIGDVQGFMKKFFPAWALKENMILR